MPRLSVAELAKTLVHFHYHGVISTLSTDGGYPYGSVIDYLPLPQGDVVVLLNQRAEHYRYLRADSKASLLVNAHLAEHESLLIPRVTLLGKAQPTDDHSQTVRDYLDRHPDAEPYVNLKDMHFFQLDVSGVRYIAGSGRAVWVDGFDYRAAKPDPLGEDAPAIMHELNDRHSDQLTSIARRQGQCEWAQAGRVVSLDRFGLDLIATAGERRRAVRLDLPAQAADRHSFEQAFQTLAAGNDL